MTLKQYKADPNFTKCLLLRGNEKLQDTPDYVYLQFNLPAIKTCPFASIACLKVCYANKGTHNFKNVKISRANSLKLSMQDNFVDIMINCLKNACTLARYTKRAPLFRLHESGDFYNQNYTNNWIDILYVLMTKDINVHAHFYTKSFIYFLNLDLDHSTKFRALLENGFLVVNLSTDESTNDLQLSRAAALKKLYPMINTYDIGYDKTGIAPESVCRCENCADCGRCNLKTSMNTFCVIH